MFYIINKTNSPPIFNRYGHPFRSARIVYLELSYEFLLPGHAYFSNQTPPKVTAQHYQHCVSVHFATKTNTTDPKGFCWVFGVQTATENTSYGILLVLFLLQETLKPSLLSLETLFCAVSRLGVFLLLKEVEKRNKNFKC